MLFSHCRFIQMTKNKYDFIQELLNNKKLTLAQKERLLQLSAEQIKKDNNVEDNLSVRVGKLERHLFIDSKEVNGIEPNPKHVADFMSLFNKRDGFKYLTHDFDENNDFEIDEFLKDAHKLFEKKTLPNNLKIPTSLWRIVQKFAFDSKQTDWTSISENYKESLPIKIGWATKELRDWSKKNKLHPIRNENYSQIINDFKRITRIESPNLEKLVDASIESALASDMNDFKIEKIELKKADFYTHVEFLKIALEIIFEEIKKRSDSTKNNEIIIKYERSSSDDGYFVRKILITHKNSFPNKELDILLKEWDQKGNMGRIKEKLKGYCHWSVETMIDGTSKRINILRETNTKKVESLDYEVVGFTHILTFYYI